jgi:hypothetical protein
MRTTTRFAAPIAAADDIEGTLAAALGGTIAQGDAHL